MQKRSMKRSFAARLDWIFKMPDYLQLGVDYLWLIDPIMFNLEAYLFHDLHWLLFGTFTNDQALSIAPFAEHTLSLSDLWE